MEKIAKDIKQVDDKLAECIQILLSNIGELRNASSEQVVLAAIVEQKLRSHISEIAEVIRSLNCDAINFEIKRANSRLESFNK